MPALTGDVTTSAGAVATALATNVVTYGKFQQVAASSLVGNSTGSLANAGGITLRWWPRLLRVHLTAAGALTPTSVASTGAVTSSGATSGIGYATGAGGAVSQGTSRVTGVTNNKACGAITMFSAAGSATWATFVVTDSAVVATDVVVASVKSATNLYMLSVTGVGCWDVQPLVRHHRRHRYGRPRHQLLRGEGRSGMSPALALGVSFAA
jgi:hypothetical protein